MAYSEHIVSLRLLRPRFWHQKRNRKKRTVFLQALAADAGCARARRANPPAVVRMWPPRASANPLQSLPQTPRACANPLQNSCNQMRTVSKSSGKVRSLLERRVIRRKGCAKVCFCKGQPNLSATATNSPVAAGTPGPPALSCPPRRCPLERRRGL